MAQTSKSAARRGKPSYFMSIVGVTLVLFFLGIVGWFVINANKLSDYFRENIEVQVYLRGDVRPKDSTAIMQYMATRPYIKTYSYINKALARERYLKDNNNESWDKILDYNPLPNGIFFHLNKEYANTDSLEKIVAAIQADQSVLVSDVHYEKDLVSKLNKNLRNLSLVLLGLAIVLAIVVIILIDNTIRLAMFSNRFLIKTMQMVGATRWFIARPLSVRAIINGAVSGIIASILLYSGIIAAEHFLPELSAIQDQKLIILLFIVLILIGITITLFSTYRSALKYLRMKLDELY